MSLMKNLTQTRNLHEWLYYPDKDNAETQEKKHIQILRCTSKMNILLYVNYTSVKYIYMYFKKANC